MVPVLSCNRISKFYGQGDQAETALAGVSLDFHRGESCVLLGPSGSGKTTLLSILGCLLSPSRGEVTIDGGRVPHDRPASLTALRRDKIGFVFQHAQLLPFLSVRENLRIVARNAGLASQQASARVDYVIDRLGLGGLQNRLPAQLSGGQRQRTAIARAILHRPAITLADEPTAALDWENAQAAIRLLLEQAKAENSLLIVITHDTRLVGLFDRVLHVDSGKVTES